jgi:hypothetical protein
MPARSTSIHRVGKLRHTLNTVHETYYDTASGVRVKSWIEPSAPRASGHPDGAYSNRLLLIIVGGIVYWPGRE